MNNCATTKRIENYKLYNKLSKSFFSQYQRLSTGRKADDVWPMVDACTDFLSAETTMKSRNDHKEVEEEAFALRKFVTEMKTFVCHLCSGWGHMAMDIHPKKSNLLAKKKT